MGKLPWRLSRIYPILLGMFVRNRTHGVSMRPVETANPSEPETPFPWRDDRARQSTPDDTAQSIPQVGPRRPDRSSCAWLNKLDQIEGPKADAPKLRKARHP